MVDDYGSAQLRLKKVAHTKRSHVVHREMRQEKAREPLKKKQHMQHLADVNGGTPPEESNRALYAVASFKKRPFPREFGTCTSYRE